MPQDTTENAQQESTVPKIQPGKIYESIAVSTAIAVQDATDNLRNINTISTTAMGVAMAQMLEQPDTTENMKAIIELLQQISDNAAENCKKIGNNAAAILDSFPKD